MELFMFFMAMIIFFSFIFIREAVQSKKKEKKFAASLLESYGDKPNKEYTLERFVKIQSFYRKHKKQGQIDDITWNDLNMDDIFKRMNYTFSASGEEYLYYTLRNTGGTKEELSHLEEVILFFHENKEERLKIQLLLHKLGYTGKYSLYDYLDHLDYLGERSNLKHIISNLLYIPLILLIPFQMSYAFIGIATLMIYNIISYFKDKNEIEPYIISFAYVMRLLTVSKKIVRVPVTVCCEEWERIKECNEKLEGLQKGSFWVFTSNKGNTSGNPLDLFLDYAKMIFHFDIMQFNKMLSQLRMHLQEIDCLISLVGYLDTAIAIGALRASLKEYSIPQISEDSNILQIKDAYHLLLEDPIENSITTGKGVLLTGSNASGKSTFLKTMATNAILAQTIHTCTASEYRAPFFSIYSSMALRDNLDSGESYYIVEIKSLKRILDAANMEHRRILCFVDEVLRGTNTVERIAASTQILKSLTNTKFLCFAATHDIELTELLKDSYDNFHFEEDVHDGDVYFNYKLLPGKASSRNAIKLLEIMGYDEAIIEKATKQAEQFIKTGQWESA